MTDTQTQRELAVVLHADVANYSALMRADEEGTHREVIRSFDTLSDYVEEYDGTVLEQRGDAVLAKFRHPSDGLKAALAFQEAANGLGNTQENRAPAKIRIGLSLGEVILDRGTIWGPGVNLSQRVEQLSEPGGVCVSSTVYDAVSKSLPVDYEDLGEQQVKESVFRAYRATLRDGAQLRPERSKSPSANAEQDVRFCRTADNIRLAWSFSGEGIPLLRVLNWATHLEWEWQNARGRHLIDLLSKHFTYLRYDARHVGLSERRGNVTQSFEERYADLSAVIDAAGHDKVALLGVSEGGPTALAYAARNPERVSHLVLLGAANLIPISEETLEGLSWIPYVLRQCWGQNYVQAKRVMAALFGLDEEPNGADDLVAFCKQSMKADAASQVMHQMLRTTQQIDVPSLAESVVAPTLIIHSRNDVLVPSVHAQYIASYIPDARLKFIESGNHVMGFVSGYDELIVNELRNFVR